MQLSVNPHPGRPIVTSLTLRANNRNTHGNITNERAHRPNRTRTRPHTASAERRHTFGSLARLAGADLKYIQKAMGHSSITVTAEIYAQLFDSELDQVSDALDALTEGAESAMYAQNTPTGPDPDADRAS